MTEFKELLGLTIESIDGAFVGSERIALETSGGRFVMWHESDCCESVTVHQIDGDIADVLGSPIVLADEATCDGAYGGNVNDYGRESATWTFYRLATVKGYVSFRWLGESNGYYSESVSLAREGGNQ